MGDSNVSSRRHPSDAWIITVDGGTKPDQPDAITRALMAGFEVVGSWTRHSGGIANFASTYVALRKRLTGRDGGLADIRAGQSPPLEWFDE